MTANLLLKGLPPTHPGEVLREDILPAVGRPKAEIARLLGIGRRTLYDLLEEKQPVTAQMALRLGKLFGNSAEFWLNLQRNYDLRVAGEAMAETLQAIPTLPTAA